MDSVTECSILKAQISKWEQLKKATQKRTDHMENKARNFYQTIQSMYLDLTEEIKSVKDILGEEIVASSETRSPRNSELYPTKQQYHQKTPKVQKIRPSIGELRDPVTQFQRIENALSTAETVSSPSDGEESGDMIFEKASLVKFARRKARRRSTMCVPRRPSKLRIVPLSPDQELEKPKLPNGKDESPIKKNKIELYPTKQQYHQKTPKVQKIRPSIGELRDPVTQFQRIENALSTAETVSSPSDGEESGDMIFEKASLVKFARRKARRRQSKVRIVPLSPDQEIEKPKLPNGKDESPIKKNKIELYPTKQQNHQKTPKVQKIRPSIGELRDPVTQFQRIENAPSTAETVSSPSDGEESGDMIFENASLVKFARRKARRRSTMCVPRRPSKLRIVSSSPDQELEKTKLPNGKDESPIKKNKIGE
ncbi:hypothetical protein QYM36_015735 [Artemia franciscana]|uniref:Uncharacterized protein n=1 Tax=Artemia franciscana TaxID=6661 RepID=A0AA88KVS2_ARTSF|nr:hypothetical protein QYM36_015735 [Artemia franciscana]